MTGDEGRARALGTCDVPVQRVSASAYTVPTDSPEADGTIAWDSTTLVLVEAGAGDRFGIGWTYAPAAAADLVEEVLAGAVVGHSALDMPAVHEQMRRRLRNAGLPGLGAEALSAVDVALWDLKARLLELPLHRLLGAFRDAVPVYGSGGFTTYTERQQAEQLEGWVTQGIPRVKIKVGEDWGRRTDRDTARVRAARAVVGPSVELYVDANGAYTPKQAVRWLRGLADADVRWFEEPVSSDDLAGLRRVRDEVEADVAAGEYVYEPEGAVRLLGADAVDCLQADATRCGGITGWLRVAALADAAHVDVSAHCAPHLHASVAAAVPRLRHLEWFHDHVRIADLLLDGVAPATGGLLRLGDAPGHGMSWRTADADAYRVR